LVRLERDLDLTAETHDFVKGTLFGRSRVDACDDSKPTASAHERLELGTDDIDPGKPDEGAEEINLIRALKFSGYLCSNLIVAMSINEKSTLP